MSIYVEQQPELFEGFADIQMSHSPCDPDWQQGLAHDLRSPLFAILGYLQLIQRYAGPASESKVGEYAALAQEAASRLNQLVDEFLHNAVGGPRWIPFEPRAVDLRQLFKDLEHTFSILAAPKEITLAFETPASCTVWADPKLLRRVLENLIGNAVKFTSPRGWIRVSVSADAGRFIFEISDNGRGISREALERIFDRFQQVESGDRVNGYGLGLAVAKLIVEAHQGKISVQSEVGIGSCFTFWIPMEPALPSLGYIADLIPVS